MTVLEIVKKYLEDNGFDGLYNSDLECACEKDHLEPCCEMSPEREAGYKYPCDCGEHDFHVGSADERDRALERMEEEKNETELDRGEQASSSQTGRIVRRVRTRMSNYDAMTNDEFDSILERLVGEMGAGEILAIGDIYTILSERLNNEVLAAWVEEKEE